ncbi:ATP-binding protein [Bifidobacterium oedipodis]|uniref:ATPase n=1 Tax=Bifidobacterium oedipodis TaxID=2675322 RepID=A0A7Y0EQW1_9BIFI|nr:AAA family ATPase [Bifidobacterium sp. DSM 109957]NMM94778.1 ATPase [Bifidobacterium sp. DSM 109957]
MKRAIMDTLIAWESRKRRKPLLVYGARQVGKTHVLKAFGQEHCESCVYIDLERDGRARAVFEADPHADLNPQSLLRRLSAVTGETINPDSTLLVLDEIQASNRALASLKYFAEDMPQLRIIGAGSLLGVAVRRKGFTMPVGKVQTLTMHPMTFPEFLDALGEGGYVDDIRECFATGAACYAHEHLMERLWSYMLVGGMPEAVEVFAEDGDYDAVAEVQQDIRDLYAGDMAKYATPAETAKIRDVWESVPAQLAKENHKFQYKAVRSGGRASVYGDAIAWLLSAGLISRCVNVNSGRMPLKQHEDLASFKVYMADTGLLAQADGLNAQVMFDAALRRNLDLGGLGENLVAQMLSANGVPLRYWTSSSTAEVDFVVERAGMVAGVPVEVKTSEHVRSRSLASYRGKYEPTEAIRISAKNFGIDNGIRSIPLYAAFCIQP